MIAATKYTYNGLAMTQYKKIMCQAYFPTMPILIFDTQPIANPSRYAIIAETIYSGSMKFSMI